MRWNAACELADVVYARDGFRCTNPVCTSRCCTPHHTSSSAVIGAAAPCARGRPPALGPWPTGTCTPPDVVVWPTVAGDLPDEKVHCEAHGETVPTFACPHLAGATAMDGGVVYDTTSLEPWPNITCRACDGERIPASGLKPICGYCWDDAFGANVGKRHPDPDGWLRDAAERAQRRQHRWTTEYRILEKKRYRYQLEESPPWLGFGSSDSRFDVLCDPMVIGSWSARSNTWLWGWANSWWPPSLTRPIVGAKRAGEKLGIERLWRSSFDGDEGLAWQVSLAALDLLPEFSGIYRSPGETGSLFLAARNTRHTD